MSLKNTFFKIQELNNTIQELSGLQKKKVVISDYDLRNYLKDAKLLKTVEKLYNDGHHARAVEEAYKLLNNIVKHKSQITNDGSSLMKQVFSAKNPILKINSLSSNSELDEQLGYMEIFSGCMTGIRNPRAHENDWEDTRFRAFQLLILADHLIERINNSIK